MESLFFLKKKRSPTVQIPPRPSVYDTHTTTRTWFGSLARSFVSKNRKRRDSGENDEEDHDLDGSHWHPLGSCAGGRS